MGRWEIPFSIALDIRVAFDWLMVILQEQTAATARLQHMVVGKKDTCPVFCSRWLKISESYIEEVFVLLRLQLRQNWVQHSANHNNNKRKSMVNFLNILK